jgi:Tfp pilus assembly protein PilN
MHTIDLLRGEGVPAKATLGGAAMVVVIVVVPILAAAAMVDRYLQNKTEIGIKQQAITVEEKTIAEFADAVKYTESLQKQQQGVYSRLSEVGSCLGDYVQWSPVLETIARYMPARMVMSSLRAESTSERQDYANRLKSSPVLGPKLEGIEVSQKPLSTGAVNTVSYTMDLTFKSRQL